MSLPRVSVLMAVHNGARHLRAAIDSIWAQSMRDFEFTCVDDASTDPEAVSILAQQDDPRWRLLRNDENLGLPTSLNRGLAQCRGTYIARMDGDDICRPERLAEQVSFLEQHTHLAACSCWTTEIDDDDRPIGAFEVSGRPDYIRWALTHRNVLMHPGAVLRSADLRAIDGYDEKMRYAQDYDLFARLVMAGRSLAITERPLLLYRRGTGSITATKQQQQEALADGVRARYARHLLGRDVPGEVIATMWRVVSWRDMTYGHTLAPALDLLLNLREATTTSDAAAQQAIDQEIREHLSRRAGLALKHAPLAAASLARALTRIPGGRATGAHLWFQAQRCRLGAWRRGASTALSDQPS